ncbi:hypothetical protein IIC65_00950, partial [Candidatus Sumerlaeota bacterium]|nr:hypothetical protein [Candidatus Sumerlaeota bacterium]
NDGIYDSLPRFNSSFVNNLASDQELADMIALMLSFSGSNFPEGSATNLAEAPGSPSQDTHAAVGKQITISGPEAVPLSIFSGSIGLEVPPETTADDAILAMIDLAASEPGRVDLIVHGFKNGLQRGWYYDRTTGAFVSDREGALATTGELRDLAAPGNELTFTLVPRGTGRRMGIDRDEDGVKDRSELDFGSDPADPGSLPANRAAQWKRYQ